MGGDDSLTEPDQKPAGHLIALAGKVLKGKEWGLSGTGWGPLLQ